jgi:hypothetical protein
MKFLHLTISKIYVKVFTIPMPLMSLLQRQSATKGSREI